MSASVCADTCRHGGISLQSVSLCLGGATFLPSNAALLPFSFLSLSFLYLSPTASFSQFFSVSLSPWMSVSLPQQAKKGLLTLTVRTRLTTPPAPSSALSPPLCRSLSSGTCTSMDSTWVVGSSARSSYRVLVEVSLRKGGPCLGPLLTAWGHHAGGVTLQPSSMQPRLSGVQIP